VTDGTGNNRDELRGRPGTARASRLERFRTAKLVDASGKPVQLRDPAGPADLRARGTALCAMAVAAGDRRQGCAPSTRRSSSGLIDNYDFDMIVVTYGESESPGQRAVRLLDLRQRKGGRRLEPDGRVQPGHRRPGAPGGGGSGSRAPSWSRPTRLDRVLLSGWYVVPNWHLQSVRARLLGPLRGG